MTLRKTGLAAIALAATALPATAQYADWEQALYDAAKAEGEVIWYVSQTTSEMATLICGEFTRTYPGVACNPIRATGSVTFQRVMQEVQARSVQGDVYSSNDDTDFVELKKLDALVGYKPNNFEFMLPSMQAASNADGYWFASNISPYAITYNTTLVTADEAPKKWQDLLDPKWKDQVAIAHPGFSGSMGMFAIAIADRYGWDYFTDLEKNKPQIGRSIADGYNLVVSGERKVAVAPVPLILQGKAEGKPVEVVFPEDGLMMPPSGTGVLANAPHPNAAKLFAEFMLGKPYNEFLSSQNRYPLRGDVETAEGVPSIVGIDMMVVDPETAPEKVQDVLEKFRDTFGI